MNNPCYILGHDKALLMPDPRHNYEPVQGDVAQDSSLLELALTPCP